MPDQGQVGNKIRECTRPVQSKYWNFIRSGASLALTESADYLHAETCPNRYNHANLTEPGPFTSPKVSFIEIHTTLKGLLESGLDMRNFQIRACRSKSFTLDPTPCVSRGVYHKYQYVHQGVRSVSLDPENFEARTQGSWWFVEASLVPSKLCWMSLAKQTSPNPWCPNVFRWAWSCTQ